MLDSKAAQAELDDVIRPYASQYKRQGYEETYQFGLGATHYYSAPLTPKYGILECTAPPMRNPNGPPENRKMKITIKKDGHEIYSRDAVADNSVGSISFSKISLTRDEKPDLNYFLIHRKGETDAD